MTALSPQKPRQTLTPSERKYAIDRLVREARAEWTMAANAYDAAGCDYNRALRAIQATLRAAQTREAERVYQQQILDLRYWLGILPSLRRFVGAERFDPLQNPSDAFSLWETLAQRGYAVEAAAAGDTYTVRVYRANGQAWQSGEGIGDNLREALVLAWWNTLGED